MSKRFGFWPHITHVIVLTFKEIKHLSDYRTVGLSDTRTFGLSEYRTVGLSDYRSDPVCMVSMGYYDRTLDFPANPDFVFRIIMLRIIIIVYNAHWTTTDEWLDPVERF